MKNTIFFILLCSTVAAFSQPVPELETFATMVPHGPIGLVNCGDDRVFAVCQDGYIMIIETDGTVNPVPFLNIDGRVESDYNAHGLLGVVFHPDYATNGYFYVNYINNDMNSVIARYSVSAGDPNVADSTSELIMLTVDQPYTVHKAGDMHFGPDGYLYFPFGDGGVATPGGPGDPDNRAQNPQTYLGKMLRIDVNGAMPYEIPSSNPYFGATDTLNEIWAIGLRNPWRFSFDRLTGDMWLPDVGHDLWEEVNFEPSGFTGGNNYGWRCYEGDAEYNFDSCDAAGDYTFPIHVYPHDDSTGGYSVTGGYVYRGIEYPNFYGKYLYCDYVSGNFYSLEPDGIGGWTNTVYDHLLENVVSFGEDKNGELYVVVRASSTIYKLKDKCASMSVASSHTNEICGIYNNGEIILSPDGGTEPYSYEWNTGDITSTITGLAAGEYAVTITDSIGCSVHDTIDIILEGVFSATIDVTGNEFSTLPGYASYQWYLNGDPIDGATSENYTATESGIYTVEVSDANGCTDMSDEYIFTYVSVEPTYQVNISISPNPASDIIYLFAHRQFIDAHFIITGLDGKILMEGDSKDQSIQIKALPAGIYQITLFFKKETGTFVFVKQ